MRVSLEGKIFGGFTLILLVLALLGYYSFENNRAYTITNHMVAHTNAVIHHIEQLNSSILNMQTGVRGYALTRDTVFLQPYNNAKHNLPLHIVELEKLISDNPIQTSHLANVEKLLQNKIASFDNRVKILTTHSAEAIPQQIWLESKVQTDMIKEMLASMKEHEFGLLKIRIEQSEKKQADFFFILMLLFGFIALVLTTVYLIVYYNLKKRKEAEQKLQSDWTMFQAVLDNASAVISIKNMDGKYILINNKFLSFSKQTSETILNKRITELLPKEEADRQEKIDREVIASGKPLLMEMSLMVLGQPKTFIVTKFPLVTEQGKPYALCTISTDISERKINEDKIEQLNNELSENLAQLENANKELESFTYSVSHDLRAPLRSIDGYTRILQEDYADKFDAEGLRVLDIVLQNAARMASLIDDLLNFSRIGKLEVSKSEVHMYQVIDQILKESPTNSPIKTDLADTPPTKADVNLLRQVWVNLINNAVKYSNKNPNPDIFIGWKYQEDKKVFYIRDNGVGFDMKYVHKLFGVFQRLHSMEEFEGTGVGLAIVQRIVHKHGGAVWAEAKPDNGATFYFHLGD